MYPSIEASRTRADKWRVLNICWIDEWMDRRMDGWTDEWMGGWMDKLMTELLLKNYSEIIVSTEIIQTWYHSGSPSCQPGV
jgi:hypothetical protein